MFKKLLSLVTLTALVSCATANDKVETEKTESAQPQWVSIFNGKDLTGWTPKFKGHKLGENYLDTFRVEDGVLSVNYDKYDKFNSKFGHLFYKEEFSHYRLRLQYRFHGKQVKGGPGWALRNNGIMIHGQTAESMKLNQSFPNSIEVQLLGRNTTANICTPGTHLVLNGKLIKGHVINSKEPAGTFGEWQTIELEVIGSKVIRHIVNGKVVMEYTNPQLDNGTLLERGTISLQAETHPTQFRNIEVKVIKK